MKLFSATLAAAFIAGSSLFIVSANAAGCNAETAATNAAPVTSNRAAARDSAKSAPRRKTAKSSSRSNRTTAASKTKPAKVALLSNKVALSNGGGQIEPSAKKATKVEVATQKKLCRKFSATVGGLIEVPCQ